MSWVRTARKLVPEKQHATTGPFGIRTRPAARLAPPRQDHVASCPNQLGELSPRPPLLYGVRAGPVHSCSLAPRGEQLWDRSCPVRSYVLAARIGPDLLGYAVQHACAYAKGPCAHMPCTRVCGRAGVTVMHAFSLAWHARPPRWPPCRHVRAQYLMAVCRGLSHARYTVSAGRRTRSTQPSRRHIADVIHRQVSLVCARHL